MMAYLDRMAKAEVRTAVAFIRSPHPKRRIERRRETNEGKEIERTHILSRRKNAGSCRIFVTITKFGESRQKQRPSR
jgi:hypothetical protein